MTGIIHFETFLLAGILLNLTPGNDTIFILTRSIALGRKAGIVSALGIATGSLIHTVMAAFGLSVIIARSILLFNIIKYAGAAYLVYVGFTMFMKKNKFAAKDINKIKAVNYFSIYRAAIVTNILNPKVALFFIAFLPQFIDPLSKHTLLPFLILGTTFIITGFTWCCILAGCAAVIFSRLKDNRKISGNIHKACGLTLVALGIKVALAERR